VIDFVKPERTVDNPLGIHTVCGPRNEAGTPIHKHIWPMNADHTKRFKPVPYVGKHRADSC
jgi:hypothetical protein